MAGTLVLLMAVSSVTFAHPIPQAPGCPVFPADNAWNTPVDDLPVANNSDAIIGSIGMGEGLHPDFGAKYQGYKIGIPVIVVDADQPKKRVRFHYADESDKGPYPIPRDVPIEGDPRPEPGSDRHALIVDKSDCTLYELYGLRRKDGRWRAGSGAIWDMNSNDLRPEGWTSADAAGLAILPGLARYSDYAEGSIDHALRFTVEKSRSSYIYPATHEASDSNDPDLPPMGLRVRLKANFDISGFGPQSQVVLQALKTYGMIVADNGSDWYISGAPSQNWDTHDPHDLADVLGRNIEVVDPSSMEP
ncbi:MAG: hypothetical protein QOG54_2612 [Actinomycetota bacterium]|nr:hypothetical protein [Actinomycetota bacterium]